MPARERVAYFNGRILPESQVLIPFRDRGFLRGDAVFDTARTFAGRIFQLEEHVARLYRSLRYVRLDPGLSPEEMISISRQVVEQNLELLGPDQDYWVSQRVSRGIQTVHGEKPAYQGPMVIVECMPLPLRERAKCFRDGIDVVIPSVRRVPASSLSPRVKNQNYLNLVLGDLEVQALRPGAWSVLLDMNGHLAEGTGSNIFVVRDGRLFTPRQEHILAGLSRQNVMGLAKKSRMRVDEKDLDLFDAYSADEIFLTSTSLCICPVRSINGIQIGSGSPPGPVTKALTEAYVDLVEFDFVEQHLKHLAAPNEERPDPD